MLASTPQLLRPSVWERVGGELRTARRGRSGMIRTPQNALLTGLLFCGSCGQPMVPTYTSKGDRRYRYYVCRVRANGECATRSVAARQIEESVTAQVQTALASADARQQLQIPEDEWEEFSDNPSSDLVRRIVRRITYDGATGAVWMELGDK